MTFNRLFMNTSIMPETVIQSWFLSHTNSCPIGTSQFLSVPTNSFSSNPLRYLRLPYDAYHVCAMLFVWNDLVLWPVISAVMFIWKILDDEYRYRLEIIWTYFPFGREYAFYKPVDKRSPLHGWYRKDTQNAEHYSQFKVTHSDVQQYCTENADPTVCHTL